MGDLRSQYRRPDTPGTSRSAPEMGAREIIERELLVEFSHTLASDEFSARCINALQVAGYRILAPGELDAETLEAVAKVYDSYNDHNNADMVRSMKGANK